MAKNTRGGQNAARTTARPQASAFQMQQAPPQIVVQPQVAVQQNNSAFPSTDSSPYHDLKGGRQYFQNQTFTIDQEMSIINYLSNTPETGSLYSMAQNMNWNMTHGIQLTANQAYVARHMEASMHNLGQNLNLVRYDHSGLVDNLLSQAGLRGGYQTKSLAQLQQALVGATYQENRFVSTSHNDFRHAPNSSTFTSRAVKMVYKAGASTQAMMPGNGPGGAFGEIVLGLTNSYRITGVRFTGQKARQQGTQSYTLPQIEIEVEVG